MHRSQRDPLIHDPEASQHVLKPFVRENDKKVRLDMSSFSISLSHLQGKSRAELEKFLSPSDLIHDSQRSSVGEAALYGIYYDDAEYDYMQHLRPVGIQENNVDSVLVEAPSNISKAKGKAKASSRLDLPPGVLPSASELPRNYESQEAIPSSIAGLQPDMDPHLRQALEALEDDAFIDDELDDDFFGELIQDGERDANKESGFDFKDEATVVATNDSAALDPAQGESDTWEARFSAFQEARKSTQQYDSEGDEGSEGKDTVGRLRSIAVIGGKRRRKGTSESSGYSMSSSSIFRNEGLQTLDGRFDQVQKLSLQR